ncbi:MAG: cation diffusion facilitator family transporter [Hyphomicrobiales bacterium]
MTDHLLIEDVASPQTHPLPEQLIRRVTWIGIAVNIALAVFKLSAGIYGNSQAVTADGIEALLDVFTVILVYAASRFWSRPPDDTHPFGHGRMETLVAVFIGVSLVAAAVGIGWQSIATLHDEHGKPPSWIAAVAALTTIIGKEILYRWTLGIGRRIKSVAVVATAWHYRTDAFSSVPVVMAVTGAILLPSWTFLDHVGAVVVAMFILHAAYKITWPSLKELIDVGAPAETRRRIRDIACANPDVLQVHDIRTRFIGTSIQADLHIVVNGGLTVREGHDIAKDVEARLIRDMDEVVDVVVHVEPPEEAVPEER